MIKIHALINTRWHPEAMFRHSPLTSLRTSTQTPPASPDCTAKQMSVNPTSQRVQTIRHPICNHGKMKEVKGRRIIGTVLSRPLECRSRWDGSLVPVSELICGLLPSSVGEKLKSIWMFSVETVTRWKGWCQKSVNTCILYEQMSPMPRLQCLIKFSPRVYSCPTFESMRK